MIQVDELTKRFPADSGGETSAVENLSFRVSRGEVFGLLGPNGAGKTTTLRMILGLMKPTSGQALINGISVARDPNGVKRQIGFVSTSVGVYQWLTAREMLLFCGDLYDMPPDESAARCHELSRILDFHRILDQRCGTLSTGQKQRVNLARALMHNPSVMLLDEPTRGLDIVGSQAIFEYIQLLRSDDRAVIVCTHRLDEAERLCDRFSLIHYGRVRHQGTLSELQAATGRNTLTDMFVDLLKESSAVET